MPVMPSPEILRKLLRYEPETGRLFWRERCEKVAPNARARKIFNTQFAGTEAFTAETKGHRVGQIFNGGNLYAHRVIWTMAYDAEPEGYVDHKNRIKNDNRLSNLRLASARENAWNANPNKDGTSKYLGVSWDSVNSKWLAMINHLGAKRNLGRFTSEREAGLAYAVAAVAAYGDFASIHEDLRPEMGGSEPTRRRIG